VTSVKLNFIVISNQSLISIIWNLVMNLANYPFLTFFSLSHW